MGAFFRTISRDLEKFADGHHLTIWKYPYRASMWMFHFRHPSGGFAWVQLYCARQRNEAAELQVSISGAWYLDDHEKKLRRHYPHATTVQVQPVSEDILLCLARQLEVLLRGSPSTLVPTEDSYVPTGNGADCELVSDFELSLRVAV